MDKEKLIKIFEELISDYEEAELGCIYDRSTDFAKDTDELEKRVSETKKSFYEALGE